MEMKHTPTPWYIAGDDEPVAGVPAIEIMYGECPSPECESVAWVNSDLVNNKFKITKKTRANAAFIVRACNAHDELVNLLAEIDRANVFFQSTCIARDFADADKWKRARKEAFAKIPKVLTKAREEV